MNKASRIEALKVRSLVVLELIILLIATAIVLIACGGAASTNSAVGGVPDQLGSATSTPLTCPVSTVVPPVAGDACFTLNVSCPGVASYGTAELKETDPSVPSKGTIIFTTGGGGNAFYEDQFVFGNVSVNAVVAAGYTAVQTNFNSPTGWLDGPGGPLKLSCRWATTAQWVHDNIRAANSAFCATGNSGAGGAIAYSLSRFGQDSIFNFVQPTGGPPFSRVDTGCLCQQVNVTSNCAGTLDTCYGSDANMFLDPAYGNAHCSMHDTDATDVNRWKADSILSSDGRSLLSYKPPVHFIFGGLDTGSGVAQAVLWENAITSQHDFRCVADAPHKIADVLDGAQAIADDLIAGCK